MLPRDGGKKKISSADLTPRLHEPTGIYPIPTGGKIYKRKEKKIRSIIYIDIYIYNAAGGYYLIPDTVTHGKVTFIRRGGVLLSSYDNIISTGP